MYGCIALALASSIVHARECTSLDGTSQHCLSRQAERTLRGVCDLGTRRTYLLAEAAASPPCSQLEALLLVVLRDTPHAADTSQGAHELLLAL